MSTSKAKKARQKLVRQGLMNPDLLRGSWHGINPTLRTTPVLHDRLNKLHNKHKRNHANYSDDSFYVYSFTNITEDSSTPYCQATQ